MQVLTWGVILGALLLGACDHRPLSLASEGAPPAIDLSSSRFFGRWLIGITASGRALAGPNMYEFSADGTLKNHGAQCEVYKDAGLVYQPCSDPDAFIMGRVFHEDGRTCTFTGPWSSPDDHMLHVLTSCSDDQERWLEIRFKSAPGDNIGGTHSISLATVDGETSGWRAPNNSWSWRKCQDPTCREPY